MVEKVNQKTSKEKILEKIDKSNKNEFDLDKYFGILKTDIDPIEFQRNIRDEWK